MKILYYNWVDYLDPERRGGGVTVYQANLIDELEQSGAADAWFLSSGISYDVLRGAPRYARVSHGSPHRRDRRFEIINSGVTAPGHFSFGNVNQLSHPATTRCFEQFLQEMGPFDIVHLNGLEGIPADVLSLRRKFPHTRFVLSLHNYYPLCPQVNLWFQEREHCDRFENGRKCVDCIPNLVSEQTVRHAHAAAFLLKRWGVTPGTWMFDRLFGTTFKVAKRALPVLRRVRGLRQSTYDRFFSRDPFADVGPGELSEVHGIGHPFVQRRKTIVEMINTYCDQVLCVSDRTLSVARKHGIDPSILRTTYIGTRHAKLYRQNQPRRSLIDSEGCITLGFLGYMRADKGFSFMLAALSRLSPADLSRIKLVIAAPKRPGPMLDALAELSDKVASLRLADGYSHDQLDVLLADVTLGVVPVMWEDNLPQVAIEMHARRIPLLTSDRGGAQELGRYPNLVFKSGDATDFCDRIRDALDGGFDPDAYWNGAMAPRSMAEHVHELLAIYREVSPSRKPVPILVRQRASTISEIAVA